MAAQSPHEQCMEKYTEAEKAKNEFAKNKTADTAAKALSTYHAYNACIDDIKRGALRRTLYKIEQLEEIKKMAANPMMGGKRRRHRKTHKRRHSRKGTRRHHRRN